MTTAVTKAATSFNALLADLVTLTKSVDVNEDEIKAGRAAEKHMEGKGDGMTKSDAERKKEEEEEEERRKKEGKGKGKEGEMAKSFTVQGADGKPIEVQDASLLLKALETRMEGTESTVLATLNGFADLARSQGSMLKTMSDKLLAQETLIGEQATLIKSLQTDVKTLGSAPAGRRAVLAITDRETAPSTTTLAKSGIPEGITSDVFFAKAMEKQGLGKVTGFEISLAESMLHKGMPLDPALVTRVMAA